MLSKILDRHLLLDFENNERKHVNDTYEFIIGKTNKDNRNKSVITLSQIEQNKSGISLLLNIRKFVHTSNRIDKAKFKSDLDFFGEETKINLVISKR